MLELSAKVRSVTGHHNEKIRKQGLVPAVLYGHKVKNLSLTVDAHQFEKVYQETGESALIKLKISGLQKKENSSKKRAVSGQKERVVLIYEVARQPVSGQPIHVDFYQVKMNEPIKIEVPLAFVGESAAVKALDGVLIKSIQSLEIEALPANLPHQIEVNISSLKTFDDNIHIKDLKLPIGVKTGARPDEVIASVIPPRTKAELDKLAEAPEEKIEEVGLAEKEKAEEEIGKETKKGTEEKETGPAEKESAKE